jgi:hypothetical protein
MAVYMSLWNVFQMPGICCLSSMSLFARSIPFKYRWEFREKLRVDLQMWGEAAMGSYIVDPGAIRCGPKVAQGQWSIYTAVKADGLVAVDAGVVAIAVEIVAARALQGCY